MTDYDVLVVGAGIGGMESSLKLADMGYRVLLVEKEPSVGGKMILLSKVFPTLDCASCISTPKMAATVHHPNIRVLTYSEVDGIRRNPDGSFAASVRRKPTFVDQAACTGCRQCETSCSVAVPDEFNAEMVSRRAAYIAFPQAVPKKAVIERQGSSPCAHTCPAGIKSHGYVSLVRSGKYEEAFRLILDSTPLVGSLGRACLAPCEEQCTRGLLEGPLPIRRIKRFVADVHYNSDIGHPTVETPAAAPPLTGKRVAVVGSGPAGLTAAWHLARNGHAVKIFEASPEPGGMLRQAIPAYRLPSEVVARDVSNVTSLPGVDIACGARVDNVGALRDDGFDAVLVATGTPNAARLRVAGENLPGVYGALDFLRDTKNGTPLNLAGLDVVVIGGGNVAIDAARSALRLGAAAVHQVCLEARDAMPAHAWEVEEALAEGVLLHNSWGVEAFDGEQAGTLTGIALKKCTAVLDGAGKFAPQYDESVATRLSAGAAIVAVGLGPDTAHLAGQLKINPNHTIAVDPGTLQSLSAETPYVFAAGDVASGPSSIPAACGQGRRAAWMIDRWLRREALDAAAYNLRLPPSDRESVIARQKTYRRMDVLPDAKRIGARPGGFDEIESGLTGDEAWSAAGRCLDCGVCSECRECVTTCPANAVGMDMRELREEVQVGAVVIATGFKVFPADMKPQYGYGRFPNVITGMQMDRLLAPTRPYNTVLRPGDGKVPENIAYVLCTGSRDETVGNPQCSRFCCMYSIKQNQLIMGALPLADVTVYYMDVRAFSKGYDEFYEQARAMGANFVRGRVARIAGKPDGNLLLQYEDVDRGALATAEHDLVVLAVGVAPNPAAQALFETGELALDDASFVLEPSEDLDPGRTSIEGVFVAGAAAGARDIPDSILHAGAAAIQAAAYVERVRTAS